MVDLTRTVRFSVNPPARRDAGEGWGAPCNTFASYPSMRGLGRHYELDITCRGEVDPGTGYFVNIKEIDQAARAAAIPAIERACADVNAEPAAVLGAFIPALDRALEGRITAVRWRLSPYHSVEMNASNPERACLRLQFEFAASHRLHVPSLSDEQNRALFGKCNNPGGHGHNYRVEPCVEVPAGRVAPGTGGGFTPADLERLTHELVIERFDHKHLNEDTVEFGPSSGLNPSVENIAKVCFDLLAPAVSAASPTARLRSVTVWETDKTSCTYPA